jgi:sortase A
VRKWFGLVLMIGGLALLGMGGWQYYSTQQAEKESLQEAKEILVETETKQERSDFKPKQNETIGILRIPKIDAELPIVEGTNEDDLKKGVGHYASTAFPGDNEQILFSGHRDTVFRRFGELEVGDKFIVELPYGTFTYEMRDSKIVPANDTSIIGSINGEDVLNISTCYPFSFIGDAPDRYVVYAYPVDK